MSKTAGTWTQDSPFTDGHIFVGASEWKTTAGTVTSATSGAGLFTLNMAASQTVNLFASILALLRTGVYASFGQQAFGTTGPPPVPGPTTVANTSSPDGTIGRPPLLTANLPTILGPHVGPVPKGLQINSIDVAYEVDTLALTSATVGLTKTLLAPAGTSAAPVVSNIIALGANGLPTATNTAGQQTTTNVPVVTPTFLTGIETEVICNVNFVLPATSTAKFYGVMFNVSFNYN